MLQDEFFNKIVAYIKRETAIEFNAVKRKYVEKVFESLFMSSGFTDVHSYWQYVQGNATARQVFINALTINESYFFRQPGQFIALRERVIPEILKGRMAFMHKLRVLSLGCAAGEEPYSLAITFDQMKLLDWVEVLGLDINTELIKFGRNGIYKTLRNVSTEVKTSYFHACQGSYHLLDRIRKPVRLIAGNICREMPDPYFDIVFCRNILIYFNVPTRSKVLTDIERVLRPGGYLFLGEGESVGSLSTGFKMVNSPEALFYKCGV